MGHNMLIVVPFLCVYFQLNFAKIFKTNSLLRLYAQIVVAPAMYRKIAQLFKRISRI